MTAKFRCPGRFPTRELSLSLIACSACAGPHVRLSAPPSGASLQERADAYEKNRPAAEATVTTVSGGTVVDKTTEFLVLGDGRRVYHPEDFLPVVADDSPTAEAARRSGETAGKARTLTWAGWGLAAASAAIFIASGLDSGDPGEEDFGPNMTLLVLGGLSTLGGLTLHSVAAFRYGPEAYGDRMSAFTTYEKDLRTRLALCADGTRLVDCTVAPPAVAPGPAAPTPAPANPAPTPAAPEAPPATAPASPATPPGPPRPGAR